MNKENPPDQAPQPLFTLEVPPTLPSTRLLGTLFYLTGWYLFSFIASTTTKELLDKFTRPITLTMAQLVVTMTYAWGTYIFRNLATTTRSDIERKPYPPFPLFFCSPDLHKIIWMLGLLRLLIKLFHKISLVYIPLSFANTIKVSSPIFMIVVSRLMIREEAPPQLIFTVLPIILGVGLCSITETNYNTMGLLGSLLSLLFYAISSILTKKTLEEQPNLDKIEFMIYSDMVTFLCMVPMWVMFEGFEVTFELFQGDIIFMLLLNGVAQIGQTLFSFFVLVSVTSLTFSVLNVTKRVVVIAGSVAYFGNHVGIWNRVGMVLAFSGVLMYSKMKYQLQEKDKKGKKDNLEFDSIA